jgi:hypothetical protein
LYFSQAKRGTTAFHGYATLYTRVRYKRYTLAVRQLVDGETTSDVLGEFLELLDGPDFRGGSFVGIVAITFGQRHHLLGEAGGDVHPNGTHPLQLL